jgi:hypothetical protein
MSLDDREVQALRRVGILSSSWSLRNPLNLDGLTIVMYRLVRVMWLGGLAAFVSIGTS